MPIARGYKRVAASISDMPESSAGIHLPAFIAYKFFNSIFLGLSVGAVFVLYAPISPEIFSAGGVGLAIATLLVATQYSRILNRRWFFALSLLVECVALSGVIGVLLFPLALPLALFVYVGYQIAFAFGNYLVRCETLLIPEQRSLTQLDVAKQSGYLLGMAFAAVFYHVVSGNGLTEHIDQVRHLHWVLAANEVVVIALLLRAFSIKPND
jgi:putative membrane protein